MKFTVERSTLIKMLQLVGRKMPAQKRRDQQVRLSAWAARVFVEANQSTGGVEALVLQEGTCLLPHDVFVKLLKSYAPKENITVEAGERAIKFGSTTLPVSGFSSTVTPPGQFQVFAVTDTWVASGSQPPSNG